MAYTSTELRAVQDYYGFESAAPVEKDWHVTRVLATVAALDAAPFRLIFAGGTALARAHKLVRRMSEDIDFKIVLADSSSISRNKLRLELGALRDKVTAALREAAFALDPKDKTQLSSKNENRYTVYHLPYGDVTGGDLRPTIQLELTYARLRAAPVVLPVSSFIAEAFGRPPELSAITCVSVMETAAEKLVALTRRIAMELAGLSRDPDPTLVRHIYDLHMIRDQLDLAAVADMSTAIAVDDAATFGNQYPAYLSDSSGETRKALAALSVDPAYRERYASFMRNMVYGEQPKFEQAFGTVHELATHFLDRNT
jgi:predicted nucleotidyltransferase component of viral defense system